MAVSQDRFVRAIAVAVATAASRATGFIRTLALAAVLGTAAVGDAYNGANSMPNMVYELLLGGVMSSVLMALSRQLKKISGVVGLEYAAM